MAGKRSSEGAGKTAQRREDRLKAALKANLARRKAQSRQRAHEDGVENNPPGRSGQNKDA